MKWSDWLQIFQYITSTFQRNKNARRLKKEGFQCISGTCQCMFRSIRSLISKTTSNLTKSLYTDLWFSCESSGNTFVAYHKCLNFSSCGKREGTVVHQYYFTWNLSDTCVPKTSLNLQIPLQRAARALYGITLPSLREDLEISLKRYGHVVHK